MQLHRDAPRPVRPCFCCMIRASAARCRGGACPSRRRTGDTNRLSTKTYQPIASVAALSERLAGWQVIGQHRRKCKGFELSLRGPDGAVAISGRQLRFRRGFPIIQPCTARFPRRFAPRNDTSGWPGGGNCALHRIRSTFAASRTGAACRSPTMARAVGDTARKFTTAHGAHYPQGARRIRKAAKPPTAAQ